MKGRDISTESKEEVMQEIRKIGRRREIVTFRNVRQQQGGYVQFYTYGNEEGEDRAFVRCGSGASVTVLPFDACARELVLIQQPRGLLTFANGTPEAMNVLACASRGGRPKTLPLITQT